MNITIRLADPTASDVVLWPGDDIQAHGLRCVLTDRRLRITHEGPYAHVPTGVLIAGVYVSDAPEVVYAWGNGARDGWLLHPDWPKAVHPRLPGSAVYHLIEPGQTMLWDFGDPVYTVEPRDIPREIMARVDALLFDGGESAPMLEHACQLYKVSKESLAYDTPPARRDVGWWMWWFHRRHQYDTKPRWDGHYYFGGLPGPEGQTNWHYDGALHALRHWRATSDPGAWALAYLAARHQATAGFVYPHGVFRGEKGVRVGDFLPPNPAWEWSGGLACVAVLGMDPWLKDCAMARYRYLKGLTKSPWTGEWGSRILGNTLRELRIAGTLSGDPAFADIARRFAEEGLSQADGLDWLPNRGYSGMFAGSHDPWQDALTLGEILRLPEGPTSMQVMDLADWSASNMLAPKLVGCHEYLAGVYRAKDGVPAEWGGPNLVSWWLPMLRLIGHPRYEQAYESVARSLGSIWSSLESRGPFTPEEIGVDSHAYGAGAMKIWSSALLGFMP